jgi:transposase-like protein
MSDDDMRTAPSHHKEPPLIESQFDLKFPDEEAAINYFIKIRYGGVLTCPHCGATTRVYRYKKRPKVCHCKNCNNSFSVFKGTIFEKSRTGILEWFKAMRQFLNDLGGISSLHLKRDKGMTKKAAWRILHQIRLAMGNEDKPETFSGLVEVDETYVGGKRQRYPKSRSTGLYLPRAERKRGRGTPHTPIFGIKEQSSGRVHALVMLPDDEGKKLTSKQLFKEIEKRCEKGSTVISDDFAGYDILDRRGLGYGHRIVRHKEGRFADGPGVHTNGIDGFWAIFKGGYRGTYHSMSVKYMQRYVDEFCFRQNTRDIRESPEEFDLLLKQCVLRS